MTEPNPPLGAPGGYDPYPVSAPLPVLPHVTSSPVQGRPGILSAIGVFSIVIACLSAVASLMSGCQSAGLFMISSASGISQMNVTANAPATQSTPNPLTPAQVDTLTIQAQQKSSNRLTKAQVLSLSTALTNPNQVYVPADSATARGGITSSLQTSYVDANGDAYIALTGGVLNLDPQGQPVAGPAPVQGRVIKVSKMACALAALDALLSFGLAIALFVGAILMLRQPSGGRKIHLIYAAVKIPLALAGSAAMVWMYGEAYLSIVTNAAVPNNANAAVMMRSVAIVWGVGLAVLGLIYPVCLLIVLNTRSVREYFHGVRN